MRISKKRGLLASAGALATAIALALSGAVAASAAPTIPTPPPANTANLNIVKLSTPTNGAIAPNSGEAQTTPAGSDYVPGVVFRVRQVNTVDLSKNAGWSAADALTFNTASGGSVSGNGSDGNPVTLGAAAYGTTNASGVPINSDDAGVTTSGSAFQNLPIGLYLVDEYSTPAGVTGSAPFLITLPMTNAAGTDWNYNVYVYPKNSVTEIEKTVSDATKHQAGTPGASVTWTINAEVPRIPNTSTPGTWLAPTSYVITDDLDSRLNPTAVRAKIVGPGGFTDVALVAGTDFTLLPAALPGTGGEVVSLEFLNPGLAKLQTAAATEGTEVEVEIDTLVLSPVGNGLIQNNASVNINNGGAKTTTTPAETRWGSFTFKKVRNGVTDDGGTPEDETVLGGAEFQVYGKDPRVDANVATNPALLASAAVSDNTTGLVAIDGLPLSNHLNNESIATTDAEDYRVYWLVETKAPTGWELLAEPIPFVLLADGGPAVQITVDSNGKPNVDGTGALVVSQNITQVANVAENAGFVLPLTGGMGTAVLTIGGIAILAIVLLVARRRREEASAE